MAKWQVVTDDIARRNQRYGVCGGLVLLLINRIIDPVFGLTLCALALLQEQELLDKIHQPGLPGWRFSSARYHS